MSRDIPYLLGRASVPGRSYARSGVCQERSAELLADQAVHLAAVRAALRLAHHEADDRPDRLALAPLVLLDGLRVRLEGPVDDLAELVATRYGQAALLDHGGRL